MTFTKHYQQKELKIAVEIYTSNTIQYTNTTIYTSKQLILSGPGLFEDVVICVFRW